MKIVGIASNRSELRRPLHGSRLVVSWLGNREALNLETFGSISAVNDSRLHLCHGEALQPIHLIQSAFT
jgi:hypothetical protein